MPPTPPTPPPSLAATPPDGPPPFDLPVSPAAQPGSGGRGPLIALGVALIAAIAGIAAIVLTSGGDGDTAAPTTVPVATLPGQTTTTEEPTTSSTNGGMAASVAELAESTVQVVLLDGSTTTCSGSGTIIDEDGTILTNAHVIEPDVSCPYDRIGIAVTTDAGTPPELLYAADIYAYDPVVDLAVLRIATDLDGAAVSGPFRSVPVGDSDAVEIGDQLRILGYPGIGGDTVTFTRGVVSGFASQNGIGERSWIKTDATIAGGNSGGAAFDIDGNLIGVPTQAAASAGSDIVDCRVITDTNGDGQLDAADQCVPIGGFLNGLRPVNLARSLITEAASGAPITIDADRPGPAGSFDVSDVYVYHPRWSLEASDDAELPEFLLTTVAGVEQLCIWFDWEEIPDGVIWDGVWQVDGVVNENFSFFSEEWNAGFIGTDYWLCASDPNGLAPGLYEFIFYIDEYVIFYESLELTETPRPLHDITFVNNTGARVCYLYVAPFGAIDTGLDELGAQEVLEAGDSKIVTVPEGTVIIDAYDCEFNPVYTEYDGLSVTGPRTIDISG
jgi:S1-C subfamily serine protease